VRVASFSTAAPRSSRQSQGTMSESASTLPRAPSLAPSFGARRRAPRRLNRSPGTSASVVASSHFPARRTSTGRAVLPMPRSRFMFFSRVNTVAPSKEKIMKRLNSEYCQYSSRHHSSTQNSWKQVNGDSSCCT